MVDRSTFLTEREIYILDNHPAKTYAQLARELNITLERVRQIKIKAERRILEQKQLERLSEQAQIPMDVTLSRGELSLINRALTEYHIKLLQHRLKSKGSIKEADPDIAASEDLKKKIFDILYGNNSVQPE